MSDDWKPGDLALCVSAVRYPQMKGRVFTVREVIMGRWRGRPSLGLRFVEQCDPPSGTRAWDHRFFVKVTPPEADEFDREVIEHMLGKPVREPSA